jgi:hypothetical protein
MFTIDDARNAMKTAEIHLARSPAVDGGTVRITWIPAKNAFTLQHTNRDGAVVSTTTSTTLESIFGAFDEKAKKATR